MNIALKFFIVAGVISAANILSEPSSGQVSDVGKTFYQSMCAACHGVDGKGNGPLSGELKMASADLTVLAKKNNGVFPFNAVYNTIDGRKVIAAHGTREMPIWGAYTVEPLYPSDKIIDRSYDPEGIIRTRILAVIDYLSRIQEK